MTTYRGELEVGVSFIVKARILHFNRVSLKRVEQELLAGAGRLVGERYVTRRKDEGEEEV